MARIEWYAQANIKLGSSLTPSNRCIDKTTAIANFADPDLLQNFEYNRLIPTGDNYIDLIKYVVKFYNGDDVVNTQNVSRGSIPNDPSASVVPPTGKRFDHWQPQLTAAIENKNYSAVFVDDTYNITFRDYDSTVLETKTVDAGETPTYTGQTPQRSGYTFSGWNPQLYSANKDQIYTAEFTENPSAKTAGPCGLGRNYDEDQPDGYEDMWFTVRMDNQETQLAVGSYEILISGIHYDPDTQQQNQISGTITLTNYGRSGNNAQGSLSQSLIDLGWYIGGQPSGDPNIDGQSSFVMQDTQLQSFTIKKDNLKVNEFYKFDVTFRYIALPVRVGGHQHTTEEVGQFNSGFIIG